jgi:hypothetical protein
MSNDKDIFLVVQHSQVPAKGEHTEVKDWGKTGKWTTYENVVVTDNLKSRLKDGATVIINVSQSKVTKNRNGEDEKALYLHFMQKYQKEIGQFIVKYRQEMLNEMIKNQAIEQSIKLGEDAKAAETAETPVEVAQEDAQEDAPIDIQKEIRGIKQYIEENYPDAVVKETVVDDDGNIELEVGAKEDVVEVPENDVSTVS